jgi:DNA-binding NtrC family response regulator
MRRETNENNGGQDYDSAQLETLKTEVLKSIARALESKAETATGVPDVDMKSGVNFYEEVTKFEIELIKRALACTRGNQRAAARLLGMKTTTLNSKVKTYNLDLSSDEE